ncbi:MAG: NifB/NifX family molybdenum-iron cluster-binding protein [Candidatus Binataceae bacterium]
MVKIAVPLANESFCSHFGAAEAFAIYEADRKDKKILNQTVLAAPPHDPGIFPKWLKSQGVALVVAGGMGPRAARMFEAYRIDVVLGVDDPSQPDAIVKAYLEGTLATGENLHNVQPRHRGCSRERSRRRPGEKQ